MKYTIEIEGVPDDCEPVAFGMISFGEYYLSKHGTVEEAKTIDQGLYTLIVRKKQTVRPWTFETAPFGVRVVHKTTGEKCFMRVTQMHNGTACFVDEHSGKCWRFDNVLESYTQLDGSPCGEVVQ